jgi:hypothetical protein
LNLFICVAEPASFNGSTRGVSPGIEKQDDSFTTQVFEGDIGAILVLQSEVGGLIIDFHGKFSTGIEVDRTRDGEAADVSQDFTLPDFAVRCEVGGSAAYHGFTRVIFDGTG